MAVASTVGWFCMAQLYIVLSPLHLTLKCRANTLLLLPGRGGTASWDAEEVQALDRLTCHSGKA